ncbi:MAG: signal peptidase II [Bacilli bacterium]|nr:signal peptidase II [Bacilli bacterium]
MKKKIIILSIILLFIDIVIKYIIVNNISLNADIDIIKNYIYITNVKNYGGAFSIFNNSIPILVIITIGFLGFLVYNIKKIVIDNYYKVIYYGFLLAGILGNLVDRIFRGYVVDYIGVNIFSYRFPIFNLADSLIVISFILISLEILKEEK